MIDIMIFSKNRPHGLIKSLLHYSNVECNKINVSYNYKGIPNWIG